MSRYRDDHHQVSPTFRKHTETDIALRQNDVYHKIWVTHLLTSQVYPFKIKAS